MMKQSRIDAAKKRRAKIVWLDRELLKEDLTRELRKKHMSYISSYRRADKAFVAELIANNVNLSVLGEACDIITPIEKKYIPLVSEQSVRQFEDAVLNKSDAAIKSTDSNPLGLSELFKRRLEVWQEKGVRERLEITRRGRREALAYNAFHR